MKINSVFAFVFLFISCCFSQELDQWPKGPEDIKKDSIVARLVVDEMNDSLGSLDTVDGMMLGSYNVHNGYFSYSKDGKVKILSIEAESCGMYCNPDYFNFIYYIVNYQEQVVFLQLVLGNISEIVEISRPFSGQEYLIFTNSSARPRSVETIQYSAVYHLRWLNGGFVLVPFKGKNGEELNSVIAEESVFCWANNKSAYVDFDAKYNLIKGQTLVVHEDDLKEGQDIYCTIENFAYEYKQGQFQFKK